MKNLPRHLALLAATAWVGGLLAVGYLAVPILFHAQPDRQLVALSGRTAMRESLFRAVAAMLLLTLLSQFGIQPLMADLKVQVLPLEISHST